VNSIRCALSYAGFYGHTFEDFLGKAQQIGFRVVELIPDQFPNLYDDFNDTRISELKSMAADFGISFTIHNVFYDINLLSLVPAVRTHSFAITESVTRFAIKLGALSLTVHPGYMFPGWRRDPSQRDRFWTEARKSLIRLGGLASELPILIENVSYHLCTRLSDGKSPLHVGIDPAELRQLVDLSGEKLGICLDIGKARHSGHSIEEFFGDRPELIKQIQASSVREHFDSVLTAIRLLQRHNSTGIIVLEGQLPDALPGFETLKSIGLS